MFQELPRCYKKKSPGKKHGKSGLKQNFLDPIFMMKAILGNEKSFSKQAKARLINQNFSPSPTCIRKMLLTWTNTDGQ